MAAQRPVSAATRVIGPHRGMAAPAWASAAWLVATAGAPRWHPKSVGCTPRKDRDLSAIAAGPLAITSMGENVRTSEISD